MKIISAIAVAALIAVSQSTYAAKPVKITPGSKGEASGAEYRNYAVQCSNGKSHPLTAWDNGKKWCLGKDSERDCVKKQIKAAKSACKMD